MAMETPNRKFASTPSNMDSQWSELALDFQNGSADSDDEGKNTYSLVGLKDKVGSGYCYSIHYYFNNFPLVESILERRFGNSLKKLHAECDSLRLKCNQSKRHLQEARKQMHSSSSQLDFLENIRHEPRFEDDVSFLLHLSNEIYSLNSKTSQSYIFILFR